jgi:hypothetical protein
MKKAIYLPLPGTGRGRIMYHAMLIMAFLVFLLFYKFMAGYFFSGLNNFEKDVITTYGGIGTGEFAEFTFTTRLVPEMAFLAIITTDN